MTVLELETYIELLSEGDASNLQAAAGFDKQKMEVMRGAAVKSGNPAAVQFMEAAFLLRELADRSLKQQAIACFKPVPDSSVYGEPV